MSLATRVSWMPRAAHAAAALALLTLALCVSLPATRRGLPYLYPWDEAQVSELSIRMVEQRDPNPHAFDYPSLPLYAYAAADWCALRMGLAPGAVARTSPHWEATRRDDWNLPQTRLVLLHRQVTAVLGALLVVLVFVFGVRLGHAAAGALGATLLATSPEFVIEVTHATVDPWMALFAALALLPLTRPAPGRAARLASAALAGMAAACKYPAGLVLVPALWLASREPTRRTPAVLELIAVCLGALVACSPFLVLDARTAAHDIGYQLWHYGVGGHRGLEHGRGLGNLLFHLRHVAGLLGGLSWLGPVGVWSLARRGPVAWPMLMFPGVYVLFMSVQRVAAARNMDPVVGLAAVCCGVGVEWLVRRLRLPAPAWMLMALTVAMALDRGHAVASARAEWSHPDSRVVATQWIAASTRAPGAVATELHVHGEQLQSLPAGTRVAPADSVHAWMARGVIAWGLVPSTPGNAVRSTLPTQFAAAAASFTGPSTPAGSAVPWGPGDAPGVHLELRTGSGRIGAGPPVDPALELWATRTESEVRP